MPDLLDRLKTALADRYAIEQEVGSGGMATVYLAHDLKHDRKVALKVLRPELAAVIGAERFLAEIKTTANLQHPHILPLHDSGEVEGTVFYVMPFVEGESLRDRLTREKQLPVGDAVQVATEVAGALESAHRKGIIHRDIKPENVLLHEGRALVADFGIALAASTAGGTRMTETGMSLGTPHYMSPEQAMGERDLDARSDIYALGCVLHEMLTGEPPFTGPTAQAIVAKVMTEEPPPASKLRKTVPEHLEDAILTALEKLPADRFASATEFASALEGEAARPATRLARSRRTLETRRVPMYWPIGFAVAAGLAVWGWLRPQPEAVEPPPSRLAVLLPNLGGASTSLQRQVALTPDGRTLLYTGGGVDGANRTMRLDLHDTIPTVLPGVPPFLSGYVVSPDGREFIGTVANSESMYRSPITGGNSTPLPREITTTSWVVWGRDGTMWFSANTDIGRGIARLGEGDTLTRPFGTKNTDLLLMQILPDNRTALTVRQPQGINNGPVLLLDLTTGEGTMLIDVNIVEIRYTAGHLVYVLGDGALEAAPFDVSSHVVGEPVRIASSVSLPGTGIAQFAVAENGTVAYIPDQPRSLVLVNRDGSSRLATNEQRNFHAPMFSPDGRRISTDFNSPDGRDVWVLDVDARLLTRATFDRDGHDATWSPDGQSLTYTSLPRGGTFSLLRTRLGSAEPAESLLASPQLGYTGVWLRDGSALVTAANSLEPGSRTDIGIVRNGGRGPVEPLVATRFEDQFPAVSPDDQWLAFSSSQSGQDEVYLRRLDGGQQIQVSLSGGIEPVWGPDGRELFYRTAAGGGSELIVATLETDPTPVVTSRRALFSVADIATATPHSNYDVSPDGQTFVMVRLNPASRIMVIQNLPALVRELGGGAGDGS